MQRSGFFDSEIEAIYQAELQRERIVVPAELCSPFPIMERTQRTLLEIKGFGSWSPKHVRDGKQSTIENRVGILPAQMLEAIDVARRERAEREENKRKRQAELQAKREVKERAREAARLAAAEKKREMRLFKLLKRARQWRRSAKCWSS